ncbi:MAG: acetylornithine/succinylornithine family transaminase [Armatimonadetes bacterium]|nr:acetylornithine/succinylornithine family transaminase [Armatimonadota bacterium]NIM23392.1 acetylornithine/succinylornithine family transaminase [Armatimonadota bacterium]NIM67257.1 acetylornithine/succinylornithine family transaminase [Armatimonadota bacterium]NIM75755.1 acetylornithine/succinylornithine family transaminase [Armatimonadota bacterium]NIN05443.1 acetylornithine/succinylornithine family transaminase [Armatimonadota bacterium]
MNLKQAEKTEATCLLNLYKPVRFPMVVEKAQGCLIWDSDGNEHLDLVSGGRAVTVLGHSHPKVVEAVCDQVKKLIHTSNDFYTEPQLRLAQMLYDLSGGMRSFLCNSGSEANEAAIKLARKHAFLHHGAHKHEIVSTLKSFHGRTFAALSATGQAKFHKGFEPLMPGFAHVPFNDLPALEKAVGEPTCAVILEPIQGEGGVYPAAQSYLEGAQEICRRHDALLILDEVQTGMGRTGKFFAYEHYGIQPDIVTLAKGLAGGVPIGAMLAREPAASSFTPSDHATTFGGSALNSAAAVAAITALKEEGLIDNARKMGEYFLDKLRSLQEKQPLIKEVRGKGLMIGIDLAKPLAAAVKAGCHKRGVLIISASDSILRLIPATVISASQIDQGVEVIGSVLQEAAGS